MTRLAGAFASTEWLGVVDEAKGHGMSRTKKGAKRPGYEYWSGRPMDGSNPGAWAKQKTHKIERQRNKPKPKDFDA